MTDEKEKPTDVTNAAFSSSCILNTHETMRERERERVERLLTSLLDHERERKGLKTMGPTVGCVRERENGCQYLPMSRFACELVVRSLDGVVKNTQSPQKLNRPVRPCYINDVKGNQAPPAMKIWESSD